MDDRMTGLPMSDTEIGIIEIALTFSLCSQSLLGAARGVAAGDLPHSDQQIQYYSKSNQPYMPLIRLQRQTRMQLLIPAFFQIPYKCKFM